MWKKKILAMLTAAAMAGSAVQPVVAQGYQDRRYDNGDNGQYDNRYNGPPNNGYNGQYDNGYAGQIGANPPADYDRDRDERDRNQYERDRDRYEQSRAARFDREAYYRECERQRSGNTVGGAIVGGLIGGLLGNSVSRGPQRGAGTAVGAILGGVVGASIGNNSLNCEDRSYEVNTYYSGFEAGIPHRRYDWRSPRGGAYGYIQVEDYYRDRGARCARYTQEIWVRGRPETARGYACRQPDGTWRMVG